jgi:hypothetical protein
VGKGKAHGLDHLWLLIEDKGMVNERNTRVTGNISSTAIAFAGASAAAAKKNG